MVNCGWSFEPLPDRILAAVVSAVAHHQRQARQASSLLRRLLTVCSCIVAALTMSALMAGHSLAVETVAPEYKLKATILYKLTHFVNWPETPGETAVGRAKTFNICILGDNPFGDVLEPLRKRNVKSAAIQIRYFDQAEDITNTCQLLFISDSKRAFIQPILQRFSRETTLTLSNLDAFASLGGIIELTQGNNKIGFTINPNQTRRAGLSIAAPLLDLATIVD